MTNVITMSGTPLLSHKDICQRIIDRDDIKHVIFVVEREDGMYEILFDRQTHGHVMMASVALNSAALDFARQGIDDEA